MVPTVPFLSLAHTSISSTFKSTEKPSRPHVSSEEGKDVWKGLASSVWDTLPLLGRKLYSWSAAVKGTGCCHHEAVVEMGSLQCEGPGESSNANCSRELYLLRNTPTRTQDPTGLCELNSRDGEFLGWFVYMECSFLSYTQPLNCEIKLHGTALS